MSVVVEVSSNPIELEINTSPVEVDVSVNTTTIFEGGGLLSGTASGTNTYTVTISGVSAYTLHDVYEIIFTNGNTGSSTININGLGAKTLKKDVSSDLVSGDISAGQSLIIAYDGTNFQVIGLGGGGSGTVESVTGDGVDNTDPANPIISYPTPGDIGAVESVTGDGVDNTDPLNPVLSFPSLDNVLTVDNSAGGNPITSLADPTDAQDAATKNYVDTEIASIPSTTPGGLDTQVQFNDGGSFGGDAGLTYNKTTNVLTADGFVVNGETASRVAIIDASKNVKSADTTTYPSLTELSYVKGVGNPIQSQINSLGAGTRLYLFNSY